jgi:mono/diheme cytochrome c family protein
MKIGSSGTRGNFYFLFVLQTSVLITLLTALLHFPSSLFAQAQNNGATPQKLNPYTGNAQAIAEGQELYKQLNCYGCHGMRGGGGMGPNLTDEIWQTGDGSDANLLSQVRDGKGKMPAFKDVIDDDQAWKIIAFVRSLYKGDAEAVKW